MKTLITIDLRRLQLFSMLVWRVCDIRGGKLVRMPIREAWRAAGIVIFDDKPQQQEVSQCPSQSPGTGSEQIDHDSIF